MTGNGFRTISPAVPPQGRPFLGMRILSVFLVLLLPVVDAAGFVIAEAEFRKAAQEVGRMSVADRIAYWASRFVGTPYDPDPLGEYVRKKVIVADARVDCMYLTFRSVELAMGETYAGAVEKALTIRFITRGRLGEDGRVDNYEDRYQYGMDMIRSGKFGRDVSRQIAGTTLIPGARGIKEVEIISRERAIESAGKIRNGDIIFFAKDPAVRMVGEIIGHIGIAVVEGGNTFLVHASGRKNSGGVVKKVDLVRYLSEMPFIGIIVTRFD